MSFKFSPEKMIIVDLYSGSYLVNNEGSEKFNLEKNLIDGKYYGYFPPYGNTPIQKRFGAKSKDESIDDILVVYVKKRENSNDREIIAFIPQGKVFAKYQIDERLNRKLKNSDIEDASYSVISDEVINLENVVNKFIIKVEKKRACMFRKQRIYSDRYSDLFKDIIQYIERTLNIQETKDEYQNDIQNSTIASSVETENASNRPLETAFAPEGKRLKRNPSLAKAVLDKAQYRCMIDTSHTTFITSKGVQYMEGHHLIPCTIDNAQKIYHKCQRNIDCCENIVCICPTCHRAIHFGDDKTKREKISFLYRRQEKKLKEVGINITEQELLELNNL